MTLKQTQGVSPVEREGEHVNESSHLPPSSDSAVLSSILAQAPLCVIAYDGTGSVVMWNAEAERVLGWRAADVLGKRAPFAMADMLPGDARREIARATRAGGLAHLSVIIERIRLDTGLTIVVELGSDLTERKRLERQVVHGVRLEAVAKLAGGIAHDFNNILAAIKCSVDLIGDSLQPGDARNTDVRAIADASERAAELTRQLLAFTRQQVLVPHVVNLNSVARSAERMLLGIAGGAVALSLDLVDHAIHVRADAAQLEQALIHLVVNAREATPAGGQVTISTGTTRLTGDPTGGEVPVIPGAYGWISVRDTGHGIPRELHGRIFEPFFTTKERGTGTGLGLSAVYGIVKQSGGYTFVESDVNAGAAFTIYLPIVEAPVATRPIAHPERTAPQSPATILLVEDESALRSLMRRILERSGYVVLEAEHGAQALEKCESHEGAIDLVVSDIVMPTMGGQEMANRLREVRPNSRLLFVSGFTDDEVMHQGIIISGSAYLQKPFSPTSLVAKIGEMLREPPAGPRTGTA
ncbi:MAG TPA: response regulator [Gemmatimonadaceae bacterium]|nr:response regulator [Gemmatimonadaceae bacterium]